MAHACFRPAPEAGSCAVGAAPVITPLAGNSIRGHRSRCGAFRRCPCAAPSDGSVGQQAARIRESQHGRNGALTPHCLVTGPQRRPQRLPRSMEGRRAAVPSEAQPWRRGTAPQGARKAAGALADRSHGVVQPCCCAPQPSDDSVAACKPHCRRRLGARSVDSAGLSDVHASSGAESPPSCFSKAASSWPAHQHDRTSSGAVADSSPGIRYASAATAGRAGHDRSSNPASTTARRRQRRRPAALHAVHLAVLAALAVCAAGTEINTAVSIFGPWDYELRKDGTSRCVRDPRCRDRLPVMLLRLCCA